MFKIIFSKKFVDQYENLEDKIQIVALKKIELFKSNTKHPSLNTHKLNGQLTGFFSFSIDMKYRIVFEYGDKDTVHFLKIGNHDIYK